MKVTIYTTPTCSFSQQEKEYLQSKNIAFEEKNVEENRDFLTELLTVSNNFAGTPVTKIEKDDGQTVVLKGFTKEEFENVFTPVVTTVQQPSADSITSTPPPAPEPKPEPPAPQPPQPEPEPTTPPVVEPPKQEPAQKTETSDALDAILKDLQNKVNETYATQQNQPNTPLPKPVDQPAEKPQEPQIPPPPPPQEPPAPQPTPPSPTPTVVPDFPK